MCGHSVLVTGGSRNLPKLIENNTEGDKMRPETAKQKINNILWNEFMEKDGLKKNTMREIIDRLKTIEPELVKLYNESCREYPDERPGEETYGYKDEESIRGNLEYISDRWNCAFRIKWILDLIKKETK